MPNELPIPPEFEHLIEKREAGDRRRADGRSQTDQAVSQPQSDDDTGLAAEDDGQPDTHQSQSSQGRGGHDRRRKNRRGDDR